jgi:hypothetical protein
VDHGYSSSSDEITVLGLRRRRPKAETGQIHELSRRRIHLSVLASCLVMVGGPRQVDNAELREPQMFAL